MSTLPTATSYVSTSISPIVPSDRTRYLAEIAGVVRAYHRDTREQALAVRRSDNVQGTLDMLAQHDHDPPAALLDLAHDTAANVEPDARRLLEEFEVLRRERESDELESASSESERRTSLRRLSPSGTPVSRVALPRMTDRADLFTWLRSENLPGHFPFTAGVFPFKRENEDPARMFAGEGDPFERIVAFDLLAEGQPAMRLSTAFDRSLSMVVIDCRLMSTGRSAPRACQSQLSTT